MRRIWVDVVFVYVLFYFAIFFVPLQVHPLLFGRRRPSTFLLKLITPTSLVILAIPAVKSLTNPFHIPRLVERICDSRTTTVVGICLVLTCISQILIFGNYMINHPVSIKWRWSVIITYATLFMVLNILYQRKNLSPFHAAMTSLFSCKISGAIYEVALLPTKGWWWLARGFLLRYPFYLGFIIVGLMLSKYKFKLRKIHFMMIIPLLLEWILYYHLPGWSVRFGPWPLLLSLSFGLSRRDDKF